MWPLKTQHKIMQNTWEKIKTVLIRLDYNVPVHNGHIVDLTRIHASKKTIDFNNENQEANGTHFFC